ncbi:MAG: hypothetical protein KAY32_10150 [Candidatus Eisenbacteria sp.]|nr:hypothetical protein [Candidatus Eisenbacteria bacterium]
MWPVLLVVGVGRQRRFPLPLPFFLTWPLVGLGWIVVGLGSLVSPGSPRRPGAIGMLYTALALFNHLRGAQVDIDDSKGAHIHVRLW